MSNCYCRALVFCCTFFSISVSALNDPTQPSSYKQVSSNNDALLLESILISENRKIAIINKTIVVEGDSIQGGTVAAINKDRVIINNGNESVELKLLSRSIRQER